MKTLSALLLCLCLIGCGPATQGTSIMVPHDHASIYRYGTSKDKNALMVGVGRANHHDCTTCHENIRFGHYTSSWYYVELNEDEE